MTRPFASLAGLLGCLTTCVVPLFSQGRGADWSTTGNDAQRSAWLRADPKISAASMRTPGFRFMWKVKLRDDSLSQPVLMDRYIGYRGFRSYAFIADSANSVFTLDTDLSRIEWQKRFPVASGANPATATCPGGMTASVTRGVSSMLPGGGAGRGGGGRGGPAKSGVGAPGEGAVTIPPAMASAPPPPPRPARGPATAAPARGRAPTYLTVLSSDGALHNMYISNGDEPNPPVRFLPANANASELIVVDEVAYAVTSGNCAGVPDGVWALDIGPNAGAGNVASWNGPVVGTAFGPDGLVYVTTTSGDIVALLAKTLQGKATYSGGKPFTSAPLAFEQNGAILVAAAAQDGTVHVVDAPSFAKAAISPAAPTGAAALASWQDAAGTRWILNGATAWKLGEKAFQPGWSAPGIGAVSGVAVVNGVVFLATAGGSAGHTRLYALDAATGKELWSSGDTIASSLSPAGGLAAGGGAIYLGTRDGTLWAFGFPIEH